MYNRIKRKESNEMKNESVSRHIFLRPAIIYYIDGILRRGKFMKKKSIFLLISCILLVMSVYVSGCSMSTNQTEKTKDCDYTVVEPEELPRELTEILEEKKSEPFRLSYADAGYLYLCIGYGKQVGGGYSITVDQLYETENTISFGTTLIGPKEQEKTSAETYPYIVVKMEQIDKEIVYLDEK